jgi:hypothetical protein
MKKILANIPRSVVIAISAIVGSAITFALLFFTLGQALTEAIDREAQLTGQIGRAIKDVASASTDNKYVVDHVERYEALLKSDRLVPHTRRTAVAALQKLAQERGITSLNYSFVAAPTTSAAAASMQNAAGAYKLSVEDVDIGVGAPFDRPIYEFISDITDEFPGAAIVQTVEMRRAPIITDTMLESLSRGEDAKIVEADIKVSWRTAQAETEKPK